MSSATQLDYRLRIRDATDASDVLVVSSVPGDTAPYLKDAPRGDGASIDPLTGQSQAGTFSGQIVDAITGGTSRVLTALLEDTNNRQQLGDRRAMFEYRVNGGGWTTLVNGYLTKLKLASDILWDVTVSDPTRAEAEYTAFTPVVRSVIVSGSVASGATSIPVQPLPFAVGFGVQINFGLGRIATMNANAAAGATSLTVAATTFTLSAGDSAAITEPIANFVARWPNRGCIFGGPVTGGLLTVADRGGWEMQVAERASSPGGLPRATWLKWIAGYGPPKFDRTRDIKQVKDLVLSKAGPLYSSNASPRYDGLLTFDQVRNAGPWPGIVVEVIGVGYFQPSDGLDFGDLNYSDGRATQFLKGDGKRLGVMVVSSTALTISGSTVRVRCYTAEVSDVSPIYWTGHPLDLLDTLWTEANLPHDATADSAQWAAVRGDVGADRRITIKVTSPQALQSFLEANVYGPFGIGVRVNASGRLEPVTARAIPSTLPGTTITNADIVQDTTQPFELDTATAIRKVIFEQDELLAADGSNKNTGDYLPQDAVSQASDGFIVRHLRVERMNGDPGAIGRGEQQYQIAGMVHTKDGKPDGANFTNQLAQEIFDRYGRGLVKGVTTFLRGAAGDAVRLGDRVLVALKQLPNHNKRYGDDTTVGARHMQVTRYTPIPVGAEVELADAGPNANAIATVPTLSIAQSADSPRTVAEVTVTNAATLNAAGYGLRLQMSATTGGAPASTDYTSVVAYPAGQIPAGAIRLPAVASGRTVYAQARSEVANFRPSSYSTPVSVALAALGAPTGLAATPNGSDGSQELLGWSTGTNASLCAVDVYLRLSTDPASAAIRQTVLPAGSVRYTLRGLTPGTSYTVGVQHRDGVTGDTSSTTEATFTAGATVFILPPPTIPFVFSGPQDAHPSIPTKHPGLYGLAVQTADTDPATLIEFAEAVETGVGTGTYGSFTTLPAIAPDGRGWSVYAAIAPNDGLRRQLKARHVRDGATTSGYTAVQTVTPYTVSPLAQAAPHRTVPYYDDGNYAATADGTGNVYLQGSGTASTQKVNVGTPTAPATMQRIYRIPYAAFNADQGTTTNYDKQSGTLKPSTVSSVVMFAPLTLPQGATIVEMRTRCWRNNSSDGAVVTLFRTADGTQTGIASTTLAANATWTTVVATSLSESVNSSYLYMLSANLSAVSGAANAKLSYVEVVVTVPDLNTGL